MEAWGRARLGDLVETQKGYAFKSGWYCDTGRPIVKVSNFTHDSVDSSNLVCIPETIAADYLKYELKCGEVVVQTVGSWPTNPASVVGKCVRIPSNTAGALLNQNAVKLSPANSFDCKFLFYLLRCDDFKSYIISTAQGTASQAAITLEAIRDYEFDLPPLALQRRIAGILSAYDELIENNQRRIRILEDVARSLYREWFVHFRYPGHESIPLVDSPLGQIPQGWEVKKLGDVLELNYGKALKKEDRLDGDVPVFGSSGIIGEHDTALVKGPGIVVGRKGNVGSVFWCDEDFFVIDTAYFVTAKLSLRFLYYDLQTKNFINNDAAVPGLSRHQAYSLETVVPPAPLLERFCQLAESFERQVSTLRKQTQNLRRTRDLLLPRLLSGQITLQDILAEATS
jgi:type I restriction enzyme S subunit